MGADIHMNIIQNGEIIKEDIFTGRNSEWFDKLNGRSYDEDYEYLPIKYGIPDKVPDKIKKDYDQPSGYGYYGFHYINAKDFCDWFNQYLPHIHAGWVTTYDKWLYERKGIIPFEASQTLYKDDIKEDMHFIEYENKYDCSLWLYNYLIENEIYADADIVYYFDC